ncbi:MAG: class I SAM-dependent methyltransferase [Labilithrix sp.]|nr:class I SAM-dependent methyltransferase [Labilithrix sp.]
MCEAPPRQLAEQKDAWLCPRCGHSFVGALPTTEQLDELYAKYHYAAGPERVLPSFLDRLVVDVIESFSPHRENGRILDVGFGDGGILRAAKNAGWDAHGVEFSRAAIIAGMARGLGPLYEGDFRTIPLPGAPFDVVVMSELIEHVTDPPSMLRRAAEVLRPGGLLYMTTPHGRGISARVLGGDWSVLCPPEHLQLFSIPSMRRALVAAGFSKPVVYTQGVLPHEIMAKVRRALPARARAQQAEARFDRVGKSHDLNGRLMGTRRGRALKHAANTVLRLAQVGDSLRVRAIR